MTTARGNGATARPPTVKERIELLRKRASDKNHSAAIVAQLASQDRGDPVTFKIGTESLTCLMVLASSEEEFEATAAAWARLERGAELPLGVPVLLGMVHLLQGLHDAGGLIAVDPGQVEFVDQVGDELDRAPGGSVGEFIGHRRLPSRRAHASRGG